MFAVTEVSCQEQARDLIGAYLAQMANEPIYNIEADRCEAGRQLLAAPPDVQMWAVVDSVRRSANSGQDVVSFYLRALRTALARRKLPFTEEAPSEPELRIAQAQLVGWLEGLFHGIQTAIYAQQMAARAQLEQMRRALPGPPGMPGGPQVTGMPGQQGHPEERDGEHGLYL